MPPISHQPIYLKDLTIRYGNKECINSFNAVIYPGSRIAIIGRNGSGKSTMLKILANLYEPYNGYITQHDCITGYVPQLINMHGLSGAERFNKVLTQALSIAPNLLLLDEPSNHLDWKNRQSLINMLRHYSGTLILITHDLELLDLVDTLWHIDNNRIHIFNGSYKEYRREITHKLDNIKDKAHQIKKEKKKIHEQLMCEQVRAKHSKQAGQKHIKRRKWPTITNSTKAMRGVVTSGKNIKLLESSKENIQLELKELYIPKVVTPKFHIPANLPAGQLILEIINGACSYLSVPVIENINLSITSREKVIIHGSNASGKSTLLKAILNKSEVIKTGQWHCQPSIGYIDQHYSQMDPKKTATILMQEAVPSWDYNQIRDHLNSYLLRKNEEVDLAVEYLSGGEKARLSLALVAAQIPKLLIMDEITNNLDLETKEHLLQVLNNYPGSFILVCHDALFVQQLAVDTQYIIENNTIYIKPKIKCN